MQGLRVLIPVICGSTLTISGLIAPLRADTRSDFAPAIIVNEQAITHYEIEQRTLFFEVLGTPGNPNKEARRALIDERLKSATYENAGILVTPEQIIDGQTEFASRANMTADEFIQILNERGINQHTFEQFVRDGIGWRTFIQRRFLRRAQPTPTEVNRAMADDGGVGGVRVLLSEIFLPFSDQTIDTVRAQAEQLSQIISISEFSEAARRYSVATSADFGGRLDWMQLSEQPPALRPQILSLAVGEVTTPIILQNAIAVIQLRGIKEDVSIDRAASAVEFVTYEVTQSLGESALNHAQNIASRVDTCDDLFGEAQDHPEDSLERHTLSLQDIPHDIAQELAVLDEEEIAVKHPLTSDSPTRLIMLCGRTAAPNDDAEREDIANALFQQRLNAFSTSYIDQLRANARIIEYD